MQALVFSLAFFVVAAVAFLVSGALDRRILIRCAFGAALYLAVDDYVTALPSVFRALKIEGASWNWSGVAFHIAGGVIA